MASLFPAWADSLLRLVLVAAGALVVGGAAFLMAWVRSPLATGQDRPLAQPVAFDHRHHVRDDGIDCLYCHADATRSPYAGVPATSVCMGCHDQIWTQSPALEPVRRSAATGTPIVWARVDNLPQHVFFDHSIHLAKGVGCVSCHGRVDQMPMVYQASPLLMHDCLDCHRHPERNLRPRDQVTAMDWVPDVPQETLGRQLVVAYDVHPTTDCSGCHR